MHCPNCGTEASAGQKFCRACGFGLEKVEDLIAEQQSDSADQAGKANSDRLRTLEKWAARALFALCGVLGGLMLWAIIVKVMIEKGRVFQGSIVLMMLAGVALALFLAYLDSERKKLAATRSNQQHSLPPAAETAKMLPESGIEMAASVTEHTTATLEEKIGTTIKSPQ
jgi:hypothetical protein